MSEALSDSVKSMLRELVGRRTGFVRDLRVIRPLDGDAELCFVAADIADGLFQYDGPRSGAAGAGLTRDAALAAALAEGLERRAAMTPSEPRFPICRRKDWDEPTCDPAGVASLAPEIFNAPENPFEPYHEERRIAWIPALELTTGRRGKAAAMSVFLGWPPPDGQGNPVEPVMAPVTSTGLAVGADFESATRLGLYEVVERDALALYWQTGAAPPRLNQAWFLETARELLPPRDQVVAFDLTTDIGLPTALVLCRGEGPEGPLVAVGSATRSNWRDAARKAAIEASQCRVYARQLCAMHADWTPGERFERVVDFTCHARLYSLFPQWISDAFGFLDAATRESNPALMDCSEAGESLSQVVLRLEQRGHNPFVVDLTPVEAQALGLHVVRALVPSLMPLHGHHWLPYLGHQRWRDSRAALPRAGEFTPGARRIWPHPFA